MKRTLMRNRKISYSEELEIEGKGIDEFMRAASELEEEAKQQIVVKICKQARLMCDMHLYVYRVHGVYKIQIAKLQAANLVNGGGRRTTRK
jgi:hypothetical protein